MAYEALGTGGGTTHATHEESVEIFLENSVMLPSDAPEGARNAELQSESFELIRRMLDVAREYCEDREIEPGSKEAMAAYEEAHNIATSITYAYEGLAFSLEKRKAYSPEEIKKKMALLVPSHVSNLVDHVKKNGTLGVQQDHLSHCVGDYVQGRFKAPDVDRVLALALTQVEIVAYIDEMVWRNPLTSSSRLEDARPPSIFRLIWNALKIMLGVWVISAGIVALPLLLPSWSFLFIIGLGIGAVGTVALLALLALTIVIVMRAKPEHLRHQKTILDMMARMSDFYREFRSDAPISVPHFKKRVNDLAEAGVVWPSGLYVLIDDMEFRGMRIF